MNISLIGMMGAGKSTAGNLLAHEMNRPFFDVDKVIEMKAGMKIPEIFSRDGSRKFRSCERKIIAELYEKNNKAVISPGGGAVISPRNRKILKQSGPVFYLHASVEVLLERLDVDNRPLLLNADNAEKKMKSLLKEREFLYEMGIRVNTEGLTPKEVVREIILQI